MPLLRLAHRRGDAPHRRGDRAQGLICLRHGPPQVSSPQGGARRDRRSHRKARLPHRSAGGKWSGRARKENRTPAPRLICDPHGEYHDGLFCPLLRFLPRLCPCGGLVLFVPSFRHGNLRRLLRRPSHTEARSGGAALSLALHGHPRLHQRPVILPLQLRIR